MDYVSENWKNVIYVAGNHEFYHETKTITTLKKDYKNLMNGYENIHYLDNGYVDLDGVRFIGSILWSNPDYVKDRCNFNEIRRINKNGMLVNLNLTTFKKMHEDCKTYIKQTLREYKGEKKVVLITHFPPRVEKTHHPKYDGSPYERYFANDFDEMGIDTENIGVWISGHTHYSYDFTVDGCRYLSNQVGCPDEKGETGVKLGKDSVFEFDL